MVDEYKDLDIYNEISSEEAAVMFNATAIIYGKHSVEETVEFLKEKGLEAIAKKALE